jgi:alpha-tubulin suppressor-like RCC1 family protein
MTRFLRRIAHSAALLLGIILVLDCSNEPTAPNAVGSVTIGPPSVTLVVGGTAQLTATTADDQGRALTGRTVTWTTSDPGVATVSPTGLVTGVAEGPVTVTATSETKSDEAAVTVVTVVFSAVSVGSYHSCGVAGGGATYCWGTNGTGQLGYGDRAGIHQTSPVLVAGGHGFASVSAAGGEDPDNGGHTCAVTIEGAAYCWGYNSFGQVGNGDVNGPELCLGEVPCAASPVAVAGGLNIAEVSAGHHHSCGVTSTGAAYCWGFQRAGELGTGQAGSQPSPVVVAGGVSFAQISAGYYHTCGATAVGAAYCWGLNRAGQLGDGTVNDRSIPAAVTGALSFTAVSAGADHTCGVTDTGAAYCWGFNGNGELGDGTTIDRFTPVPVEGGLSFVSVTAGTAHSCGITDTGAAYCWGFNGAGELGDGTTVDGLSPVPVTGGLTFTALSAGQFHTCGLGQETLYCWGDNIAGQLGDGTTTSSNVPVKVLGQP